VTITPAYLQTAGGAERAQHSAVAREAAVSEWVTKFNAGATENSICRYTREIEIGRAGLRRAISDTLVRDLILAPDNSLQNILTQLCSGGEIKIKGCTKVVYVLTNAILMVMSI